MSYKADDYGRKGITFYYNWMEEILKLPAEMFEELLRTYFAFCLSGEEIDSDNLLVNTLLHAMLYPQTIAGGEKYAKRSHKFPYEDFVPYFEQGMKNSEIAKILGCSDSTVRNKRKEWEEKGEPTTEKEKDKEQDKDKDKDKDKEKEKEGAIAISLNLPSNLPVNSEDLRTNLPVNSQFSNKNAEKEQLSHDELLKKTAIELGF